MKGPDLQIATLFNVEDEPPKGEAQDLIALKDTETTAEAIYAALISLGYHSLKIPVLDSLDELQERLTSFSQENTFIFNSCDGFTGENIGQVKVIQLIEELGYRHTGSTSDVIALCTDKARAKERMLQFGIPTPPFQVFDKPGGDFCLNYPVIVKPLTEDASMGIDFNSVVLKQHDLWERVDYISRAYRQPAIVEEFISGRELAVAMWGNQIIEALPITEEDYSQIADPLKCLLTYEAKWIAQSPYYQNIYARCPAPLSREAELCVEQTAIATYQAIGLRDFGRVDMRLYNGIPYVIDVNELPDLDPEAGFSHSAQAAGCSYETMVEKILDLALKREEWR